MMSFARRYFRYHSSSTLAPLMVGHDPYGTIKNSYLVILKSNVSSSVLVMTAAHESDPLQLDGDVKSVIQHLFGIGYSRRFTDGIVDKIREGGCLR